jgi:peptidoglycan/xylan/chitin deacetylase (PgdA/CDA1 family)
MRDWSVGVDQFDGHLAALRAAGYESLDVTDYVGRVDRGEELPERLVVITFDDGFEDFETAAVPAMVRHGFTASIYVSTAYVGDESTWLGADGLQPMLGWDGIRRVADAGFEVGAHSHHHWALDELPVARAVDEIARSKELLESALDRPVWSFAYPHGYHSTRLQDALRSLGFTSACGVRNNCSSTMDDRFAIARVIVPPTADGAELVTLMDTIAVAPSRELLRTKAWRVARRARARTRTDAVDIGA